MTGSEILVDLADEAVAVWDGQPLPHAVHDASRGLAPHRDVLRGVLGER
jgi:hypothetical protein